jgi:hypothetical protein
MTTPSTQKLGNWPPQDNGPQHIDIGHQIGFKTRTTSIVKWWSSFPPKILVGKLYAMNGFCPFLPLKIQIYVQIGWAILY